MNKLTQVQFVKDKFNQTGEVSRNECLRNFITRLASIITILKKQGWIFQGVSRANIRPDGTKGKDFVYKLVAKPGVSKDEFGDWKIN